MRVGIGYDVHKFSEGRKLILGGVEIPFDRGLLGHSDADCLVHAIIDSLLGAMGLKDIGTFFPDTDPKFKGISSITLLKEVKEILYNNNYEIGNIDSIIICEKPKMSPHIDLMRKNISEALEIDIIDIAIKATTEEGLGFTGVSLGIACKAICTLDSL